MFARIRPLLAAVLSAALTLSWSGAARAQTERIGFVRDAEIETIIRIYATPIFKAAGLNPSDVQIHLVNDPRINAFVAGGLHLFLNTGLIQRTRDPNELIGVIAHETGHIAGGHLVRVRDEMANASLQALIGTLLGAAAAVAAGDGSLGAAVASGSQEMARRNFLQYSRAQESAADHAALRFLDEVGMSSRGLVEFLGLLEDQELLSANLQDPYLRTHPITRERVETARRHLVASPHADAAPPPEWRAMHARMLAKLDGFLLPPRTTLGRYKEADGSVANRYARAIAHYRQADLGKALPLIDALLAEHPQDPYFHELRGQMLFENGRAAEALPSYAEAVRIKPDSALLRQELGRVMVELHDPAHMKEAITHLNEAVRIEPRNAGAWRMLGIAYGRDGQMGLASLALAESAMLRGAREEARLQSERARRTLPEGSAQWLRADDLKRDADRRRE